MVFQCSVPSCRNRSTQHRFPNPGKDEESFNTWIALIRNPRLFQIDPYKVYKNYRVCHEHFTPDDESNMFLKHGSFPSKKLPGSSQDAENRTVSPVEIVPEVRVKICRLCLKESDDMQNVHNPSIIEKLHHITSVPEPLPGDGLPEFICEDCEKRLTDAFSFKNLCEDSDKFLRQPTAMPTIKLENDFETLHDVKSTDDYFSDKPQIFEHQGYECSDANPLSDDEADLSGNKPEYISVFEDKLENKVKPPRCVICGTLPRNVTVEEHINLTHKSETNHFCFVCDHQFYDVNLLRSHLRNHRRQANVKPKVYGKVRSKSNDVEMHTKVIPNDKLMFRCNVCCKKMNLQCLLIHHKQHSGQLFQCNTCREKFTDKSILMNHTMTHTTERSFTGKECGKSFVDTRTLSKHEKGHRLTLYQCKECMKSFQSPSNLEEHRLSHTKNKRSK